MPIYQKKETKMENQKSKINAQILQFMGWENIPERYLKAKSSDLITHDTELFKKFSDAFIAYSSGKNIILLGGVGRGKSFFSYELAYFTKCEALELRGVADYPILCYRASQIISTYKANFSNAEIIDSKILRYHSYKNSNMPICVKSVIIDEVDDVAQNDYAILNEIIITCYERMIPLILIGNKFANTFFENFNDKAISRLNENSLIIQTKGDDLRGGLIC